MLWDAVEAALQSHISAQWALGSYATTPVYFENDDGRKPDPTDSVPQFVSVSFDGTFAEKSIYGSAGNRLSVEGGLVFYHAFVPRKTGKATALALCGAMAGVLELQVVSTGIQLDGANPPSPVADDRLIPNRQPKGNWYRCSGSVPFIVIGTR